LLDGGFIEGNLSMTSAMISQVTPVQVDKQRKNESERLRITYIAVRGRSAVDAVSAVEFGVKQDTPAPGLFFTSNRGCGDDNAKAAETERLYEEARLAGSYSQMRPR
jgi:hypothetical protein